MAQTDLSIIKSHFGKYGEVIWSFAEAACKIFDEMWDKIPIRHLGIHTSHVTTEGSRQLTIFDTVVYEKMERLDKAVAEIRMRFGMDSIKRASFINDEAVDHMSGGIRRIKGP